VLLQQTTNGGDTAQSSFVSSLFSKQEGLWVGGPTDVYTVTADGSTVRYDSKALHYIHPFGDNRELHAVWGRSSDDVWVAGIGGRVARTVDHATTWHTIDGAGDTDVRAIWGTGDVILLVGSGGTILRREK
jgi:hypothetical protein